MNVPTSSDSHDHSPPAADAEPLFLAPPPLEHFAGGAVRAAIFFPRSDQLQQAASAEEIAPAVKDTQAWLERILRPAVFEAFRDARWVGFREGTFEEIRPFGHVIAASAMTGLGEVQVLGFSKQVTVHLRLTHANPSSPPSAWLEPSLELADRVFQLESPKGADEWGILFPGQFLLAKRRDPIREHGWKAIWLVTDGHGVALWAYKIAAGVYHLYSHPPDFNELTKPDPNWFAPPPNRARPVRLTTRRSP